MAAHSGQGSEGPATSLGDRTHAMGIGQGIRTLVVDDERAVCDTIRMILRDDGYKVHTYTNPEKAIEACKRTAFDIALIDIKMPPMSGTDLVEQLHKIDPRIGVILITAYPDVATAAQAMRSGGRDYLTKPFSEQQLLAAVQRLCSELGLIYTSEEELNRLIGHRIRQYRQQCDMTLRELSERAELTTSQLSQVELGKNAASLWSMARVSGALGIKVSELLQGL